MLRAAAMVANVSFGSTGKSDWLRMATLAPGRNKFCIDLFASASEAGVAETCGYWLAISCKVCAIWP